jgi:hypothetical protein
MRHSIINRRFVNGREWSVMVQLIPETPGERLAIGNASKGTANEKETHTINKYLDNHLGLGRYSIVRVINRINTTYTILVYIE